MTYYHIPTDVQNIRVIFAEVIIAQKARPIVRRLFIPNKRMRAM